VLYTPTLTTCNKCYTLLLKTVFKVVGYEKEGGSRFGKVANDRNMLGTVVIDVLFSFNFAVILKNYVSVSTIRKCKQAAPVITFPRFTLC